MADGLGDIVKAVPQPVREIGQQLINKATGNLDGDALTRISADNGASLSELALLVPQVIQIAEKTLDVNTLKGQTVGQVLTTLASAVNGDDRATVEKAQKAAAMLPLLNDLPFEEMYLRANHEAF